MSKTPSWLQKPELGPFKWQLKRRTRQYVEEPSVGFSFQSAEMCDRGSTFMNDSG